MENQALTRVATQPRKPGKNLELFGTGKKPGISLNITSRGEIVSYLMAITKIP